MIKTYDAGHSIYRTIDVVVAGNTWAITKVTGKYPAVTVLKKTNNPFALSGRPFANFEAAISNYKSASMKTALILAEAEFNEADKAAIVSELNRLAVNN